MNFSQWITNVFQANNRTHILFFLGVLIAGLQANAGFRGFEGNHPAIASVFALIVFVYSTYNHPTEKS